MLKREKRLLILTAMGSKMFKLPWGVGGLLLPHQTRCIIDPTGTCSFCILVLVMVTVVHRYEVLTFNCHGLENVQTPIRGASEAPPKKLPKCMYKLTI